jgi:hypothetical protein
MSDAPWAGGGTPHLSAASCFLCRTVNYLLWFELCCVLGLKSVSAFIRGERLLETLADTVRSLWTKCSPSQVLELVFSFQLPSLSGVLSPSAILTCSSTITSPAMSFFTYQKHFSFTKDSINIDEESKTGLLSRSPRRQNDVSTFRIHTSFAFLHAIIAMLWLSTFWTFTPLYHKDAKNLKLEEFGESFFLHARPFY